MSTRLQSWRTKCWKCVEKEKIPLKVTEKNWAGDRRIRTEEAKGRAPWGPELHLKEMKLSLPHYSVPHCPHPPTSPEAGPDMTGAGSGPSPHALGSRCQESRRWFPPCYGISTPGTQQVPGCYPQRTAQRGCRTLGRFFA